jgi:aspartate-semialdehyde dehydrogenase
MLVNCTGLTGAGQAASGAGAKNMRELVAQMRDIGAVDAALMDDRASILALDTAVLVPTQRDILREMTREREEEGEESRISVYALTAVGVCVGIVDHPQR